MRMDYTPEARKRRNACTRKVPYASENDALAVLANILVDYGTQQTDRHGVYACEYCRYWHITSHLHPTEVKR